MQPTSRGIQIVVPVPSFSLSRSSRRLAILIAVFLGIVVLGYGGNLVVDSPSRAARQWADAMQKRNQSAVLERTCSSMQSQVWTLQQLSAHNVLLVAMNAKNPGLGKKVTPGLWSDSFDQVEKAGIHARVRFDMYTQVETPIKGTDAVQSVSGGVISEYWNMTREGWGARRWKWCGYGGPIS